MSVRVLVARTGEAVLYCGVSAWAFGPLFEDEDEAMDFLAAAERGGFDVRRVGDLRLEQEVAAWRVTREQRKMGGGKP